MTHLKKYKSCFHQILPPKKILTLNLLHWHEISHLLENATINITSVSLATKIYLDLFSSKFEETKKEFSFDLQVISKYMYVFPNQLCLRKSTSHLCNAISQYSLCLFLRMFLYFRFNLSIQNQTFC